MGVSIELGDIAVDVELKDIKNVHLSVYPPVGAVRVAAPKHMSLETVRLFVISKLEWIRQEQRSFRRQRRETPREFLTRESHYLWGERFLLRVDEEDGRPERAYMDHKTLVLEVRVGASEEQKRQVLARWYRRQVHDAAAAMLNKWEPRLGVKVEKVFVQRMKTQWGSCNPQLGNIRLNTELAKKPRSCLEYILVHEMTHLIEPTHNERFQGLMSEFLPNWRQHRDELNRAPLAHESWVY